MKIDTIHPEYSFRLPQWERTRDAIGGVDTLRKRITNYIPKLSGYTPQEYDAYVNRASWYGATARTVMGLVGSVMRKPPVIIGPDELIEQCQNFTLTGVTIESFIKMLLGEVLGVGRRGVLLDMPPEETGITQPYGISYRAEQIIHWPDSPLPWMKQRPFVTLLEHVDNDGETIPQIIQLSINPSNQYQVQKYRQIKGEYKAYLDPIIPKRKGQPLTFIPFCYFNEDSLSAHPSKSSLLDLVDLNLSHYRNSADLENGRHWLGCPQPWVTGEGAPKQPLPIGNGQAWFFANPEAKVGMLEFSGQGLASLETALTTKEGLMAVLGARMLEARQKAVEATNTVQLRQSGETSILQSTASIVGQGMTKLLQWSAWWQGSDDVEEVRVALNSDFLEQYMSAQELTALVDSWQKGAISHDTLYHNLERGEVSQPGITADVERERIQLQKPNIGTELDAEFDLSER